MQILQNALASNKAVLINTGNFPTSKCLFWNFLQHDFVRNRAAQKIAGTTTSSTSASTQITQNTKPAQTLRLITLQLLTTFYIPSNTYGFVYSMANCMTKGGSSTSASNWKQAILDNWFQSYFRVKNTQQKTAFKTIN